MPLSFVLLTTILLQLTAGQQPLRSGVVLVPVDVRVLDDDGNPIGDLTADDFEVVEDGVLQEITLFARYDSAPVSSVASQDERRTVAPEAQPNAGRTFLLVLGRGDLEGPSRGLTALVEFVNTKLLPNDRIAVLAYKRATDFTVDTGSIAALLQHYKRQYRSIENRLREWFIADDVDAKVRAFFAAPGLPQTHELPHRFPPTDLGQLYLGIDYLRRVDGEKHLIFVSEQTPGGRRIVERLGQMAADARIAISIVRTGGSIGGMRQPSGRRGSVSFSTRSFQQLWGEQDARALAEHTGGQTFLYRQGDEALDEIERSSRVRYLLGYYPSRGRSDDSYRRIEVKVKRRGATVLHRHGYYARSVVESVDYGDVLTSSRILAAAASLRPPHDIPLTAKTAVVPDVDDATRVRLDLEVQMQTVALRDDGHARVGSLNITTFVADTKQDLIGELWQQVDIKRDIAMPVQIPLRHMIEIPVGGVPRYIKVVVYDSASDRLGVLVIDVPGR